MLSLTTAVTVVLSQELVTVLLSHSLTCSRVKVDVSVRTFLVSESTTLVVP